jgi:hypothetical protein
VVALDQRARLAARKPGPKYGECGINVTPAASASVATFRNSVTPPTLVTLGCA